MPMKGNVIKSIVKSKILDRTLAGDQAKFFRAFTKAEETTRTTSVDFKNILAGCTIDTLKRMMDYLKHDKTKSSAKVEKLCGMTGDIQEYYAILVSDISILIYNCLARLIILPKEMMEVQTKTNTAINMLTTIMVYTICKTCHHVAYLHTWKYNCLLGLHNSGQHRDNLHQRRGRVLDV